MRAGAMWRMRGRLGAQRARSARRLAGGRLAGGRLTGGRLTALLVASILALAGAALVAPPAGATAVSPSTSSCTATDTTQSGSAESAVVTDVHPGDSLAVSCTGLPESTSLAVVEVSPLGGVITPSSDAENEADIGTAVITSSSSSGGLSATFKVPSTFSATDPNASCPPSQAQVNAGLVTCVLVVASLSGQAENEILLDYYNNPTPAEPTLALSPASGPGGTSVSVSDASGATGFWWGDALQSVSIPASNVLVGTTTASSSSVSISAASYAYNSTTPADSVLTPPKLSGSFTVPKSVSTGSTTVSIYEANSTPFKGNSTNSSFPNDVTASASFDVTSAVSPLEVTTTSLPSGTVGTAYSATLSASGGTPPYTWSVSAGSVPPGLSLLQSGTISGTPTTSGTFSFTVKVTDSTGTSATADLSITIAPSSVTPPPPTTESFSAMLSGGSANVGATLEASGISASAKGTFSSTSTSGTFDVTVEPSDIMIHPFVASWFGVIPVPMSVGSVTPWVGTATMSSSGIGLIVHGSFMARIDLLGLRCTLGPIDATLTTGQSGSLQGSPLMGTGNGPYEGTLVDGTFTVPVVAPSPGCGPFAAFITDVLLGLPTSAGQSSLSINVTAFIGAPSDPPVPAGGGASGYGGLPSWLSGLLGPSDLVQGLGKRYS